MVSCGLWSPGVISFTRGSLSVPGFSPRMKGVEILLVTAPEFRGTSVSQNVIGNCVRTFTLLGELSLDLEIIVGSPRLEVGEVIGGGLLRLFVLVERVVVVDSLESNTFGSLGREVLLSVGDCSRVDKERRVDFL